jgi:hypothetical protein
MGFADTMTTTLRAACSRQARSARWRATGRKASQTGRPNAMSWVGLEIARNRSKSLLLDCVFLLRIQWGFRIRVWGIG